MLSPATKTNERLQDQVKQIKNELKKFSKICREDRKVTKNLILIGVTGAGKSTVVNYLAGKQLEAIEDKYEDDEYYIEVSDAIKGIEIGKGKSSCTKMPARWISNKKVAYWDCPGFSDTEGPVQDITNAYYISKLFNKSMKA